MDLVQNNSNVLSDYMASMTGSSPRPYNKEIWITESCDWVVPLTGWYEVWCISGGNGAIILTRSTDTYRQLQSGCSGEYVSEILKLTKGEIIPISIGAGGISYYSKTAWTKDKLYDGGNTTFGNYILASSALSVNHNYPEKSPRFGSSFYSSSEKLWITLPGGGTGINVQINDSTGRLSFWGSGGTASVNNVQTSAATCNDGTQGAIRIRYNDPSED